LLLAARSRCPRLWGSASWGTSTFYRLLHAREMLKLIITIIIIIVCLIVMIVRMIILMIILITCMQNMRIICCYDCVLNYRCFLVLTACWLNVVSLLRRPSHEKLRVPTSGAPEEQKRTTCLVLSSLPSVYVVRWKSETCNFKATAPIAFEISERVPRCLASPLPKR
jgi:hypothetical protein